MEKRHPRLSASAGVSPQLRAVVGLGAEDGFLNLKKATGSRVVVVNSAKVSIRIQEHRGHVFVVFPRCDCESAACVSSSSSRDFSMSG